jgi:anti-anti-sigma factor
MSGAGPKPGSFEISSEVNGDATIVRLRGELDLASAGAVEDELAAIEEQRPACVVIDLGELAFIDSSGLRVLLLADSRAREAGYELVLAPGPEPVQRVFEMTGALDVLRFQP